MPFLVHGASGLVIAGILIFSGTAALWFVEIKSRQALNEDSAFNHILKSEGENLIERKTEK